MVKIVYFSGTGNTACLAGHIEKYLLSKGQAVKSLPLEITGPEECSDGETLYFGFPIYACEIPQMVRHFVESLPPGKGTEVRLFCTKAYFSGKAMVKTALLFEERGYSVLSWYERKMPGSDGLAFLNKEGAAARKLMENFDHDFTDLDRWLDSEDKMDLPRGVRDPGGKLFGLILESAVSGMRKKFHADEKCISCGKCANHCPVGNISLDEGKVVFDDKCALCMRCIHQCPVESIQIGKMTSGKFRYGGPEGDFRPPVVNRGKDLIKNK